MRKLVTLRKIDSLHPIEGADFIEKAVIDGWNVVVKKGEFKEGQPCIYFEIDSLLPDWPQYEFLRKSSWKPDIQKYRLKTAKLRGVVSQGLVLPLSSFDNMSINWSPYNTGDDLTELLEVEKYEPPIPASLGGDVNKFTWPISRTDEERIQNMPEVIDKIKGEPYYITIKLDGSSASFMLVKGDDGEIEFHACSRNYSIKRKEGNTIWKIADKYNIERKLKDWYLATGEMLAIQGEIVGPGIQKNKLNLPDHDFYFFNIVDVETNQRKCKESMFTMFTHIPMVPLLESGDSFPYKSMEDILNLAEGKYKDHIPTAKDGQEREGIVIRSKDQSISFKVVSNRFLLKGGE